MPCRVTIQHGVAGPHSLHQRRHQLTVAGRDCLSVQGPEKREKHDVALPRLVLGEGITATMFSVPVILEDGKLVVRALALPAMERSLDESAKGMLQLYRDITRVFTSKKHFRIQHLPFTSEWTIVPATYEEQEAHKAKLKHAYPTKQLTVVEGPSQTPKLLTTKQRDAFLLCARAQGPEEDKDDDAVDLNALLQGLSMGPEDDVVDISGYF